MTIEYVNNEFDIYTMCVDTLDISCSTAFWVEKGLYHNNSGVVNKYTNLLRLSWLPLNNNSRLRYS